MIEAIIVDVDGTLYSQKKLRTRMTFSLLHHVVRHPNQSKSIIAVWLYRKEREKSRCNGADNRSVYNAVAGKLGISSETVIDAVNYWMHQYPLHLIPLFTYKDFVGWINKKKEEGTHVYIYSDYPAIEKCKVLGVSYNAVFTSDKIGYLKPDYRAMEYVINHIECDKGNIVYIGDRDEVDGLAASSVGIRYYNIRRIRKHGKIKEI